MPTPPPLTDLTALARNRARASSDDASAMFLHLEAIDELQERLSQVNKSFTAPAIVTGFPEIWGAAFPDAKVIPDDPVLALNEGAHDLVIHGMGLHWANDPVGQMVQARRALRPDGLFLAIFFGGKTLHELRDSLSQAEVAITGGLSPRIAPMGEIRDLGGLLQRAGLALPVADQISIKTSYQSAWHLMRELRAMGETNALAVRNRLPLQRRVLTEAAERYQATYEQEGRIPATFELIILTGWAPDASQPKPLRPGSATARLADVLDTREISAGDTAKPDPV